MPLGRQSVKHFLLPVKLDYAITSGGAGFHDFFPAGQCTFGVSFL